jgi:hypothetical protein
VIKNKKGKKEEEKNNNELLLVISVHSLYFPLFYTHTPPLHPVTDIYLIAEQIVVDDH